ncbi:benzoate 1,2-dioxygenase electron transfer component BenC [Amycolatopsis thermoflava]|uniref:benzoate 1,2-dioxygenase electron transfer component BenC n=1 Tax=Amycolatopsis thermoflava TaxID=84480 RepID=UPI0004078AE0|nr:benzoate 1,2-dioxygenase electron transfer component BenC [Amycolatopsis thermoflava]
MAFQVALSFEDGVTRFIKCEPDQTVADASYRQRINIPLDCRDGACGTCKAFCESGDYDGGTYIDDALSPDEASRGYVLPCSMKPRSDLVLQIASTSAVAKTQAATYSATLTGLDRLSPTTFALTLETPDRDKLAFLPGQYVNIEVPGTGQTRSYSFSNAPDDKELTFLVKLTPGGLMSDYLTERAAPGDELRFTGPNGSFFLRETERPVLLLAGGTGLAPILSILRAMRACGSSRPAHLVYGVSTDDDLVELDTLASLAAEVEGLTWDYCVADPDSSAPNKGYVTSLIREEHLHGGDVAVYLCGPPPMVEAVRKHFTDAGVQPTGFYYEKFALAAPAGEATAGANAAGRGQTPGATAPAGAAASGVAAPGVAVSGAAAPGTAASGAAAPGAAAPGAAALGTAAPGAAASGGAVPGAAVPGGAAPAATASARSVAVQTPAPPAPGAPAAPGSASPSPERAGASRTVAGQAIFPPAELAPLRGGPARAAAEEAATARTIAGQPIWPAGGGAGALDAGEPLRPTASRAIAGQEMLPRAEIAPLTEPPLTEPPLTEPPLTEPGRYEIGEEHPSVHESDAVFEARQALELGAVEITIGRLSSQQLAGYRLLAEATLPYVDGDRFLDAAAYTETNAAFHDYLFTLTGNEHLLQAYHALGVKGHMTETLRDATWCHPRCAQDHLDIVAAFEAGDRTAARRLVAEHAERSKTTMRRAMDDKKAARRPRFISPGRFDGKVVVVTGAAQGIGERVARRISAEGGTVVLADRADLVTEVADELTGEALPVLADLETWAGAQAVAEAALARYGRIDVLVNNVGGAIWFKPFTEFTPDQIDAEIRRSLMTTLYSCRAALPSMAARGRGVIVNVSSAATRGIHRIPYSAAKGGINAITASLALEYADAGIRVVATAPGGTEAPPRRISRGGSALETEQERAWFQAHIDQTVNSSLMKRYGTLDEQAAAITFLASDEASYITGTVLPVAGGDLG